jgi:hypothetical protein
MVEEDRLSEVKYISGVAFLPVCRPQVRFILSLSDTAASVKPFEYQTCVITIMVALKVDDNSN